MSSDEKDRTGEETPVRVPASTEEGGGEKKEKSKKIKIKKEKTGMSDDVLIRLAYEIRALSASAQVIADQISKRMAASLSAVMNAVEGSESDGKRKVLSEKKAFPILKRIKSRKLKPAKGRIKDLIKIERAVEFLEKKLLKK